MTLACRRLGLDEAYARGFDRLPTSEQDRFRSLRAASLDEVEQRRALPLIARALLEEADALEPGISDPIRPVLKPILEPDT
jgi:hypothetical protein